MNIGISDSKLQYFTTIIVFPISMISFHQVDIVIAPPQGIIVIELKDYSGWIFGNGNPNPLDSGFGLW